MKKSRGKYLIKNTIILTIGNFASKLITFFLIPLYTNVLTTAEYGKVDLIMTICMILIPVLSLNISESVMRYSLDKNSNIKDIIKISNLFFIISCFAGLILIPIFNLIDSYKYFSILIYFYFAFSLGDQIYLSLLKGQERLKRYTFGNVLHTLLIAVFNIIFLVFFKYGIKGYMFAYIISNLIILIYAFIASGAYKFTGLNFDNKLMKSMISYSVVLIPTSFMWWIMNSSDRIMVKNMVSESANGIYAISYKLPTLISTIIGIFTQAWLFSAIDTKDSKDQTQFTNKVYNYLFILCSIMAISLLLICKPFMKLYVAPNYFEAWKYMSYLIIGVVFQTLATFISTTYNVYKDNKGFLYSGLCGAILNIVLNFILIPIINVHGAALATCLSYIAVFVYRIIDTRKYIKINIINYRYIISFIMMILAAMTIYIEGFTSYILIIIELLFIIILNFQDLKKGILEIFNILIRKKVN